MFRLRAKCLRTIVHLSGGGNFPCWFLRGSLFQKDCSDCIFRVRDGVFPLFFHLETWGCGNEEVMCWEQAGLTQALCSLRARYWVGVSGVHSLSESLRSPSESLNSLMWIKLREKGKSSQGFSQAGTEMKVIGRPVPGPSGKWKYHLDEINFIQQNV